MNKKWAIVIISVVTVASYLFLFLGERLVVDIGGVRSGFYTPWPVYLLPGLLGGAILLAICSIRTVKKDE